MLTPLTGTLTPLGVARLAVATLIDDFTTDDAAPITTPRTCEPGPGTLEFVNPGRFSISGGLLALAADAADGSIWSGLFDHAGGRAFGWWGVVRTAGAMVPGVHTAAPTATTNVFTIEAFNSNFVRDNTAGINVGEGFQSSGTHNYHIVRRTAGGAYFFYDKQLVWVSIAAVTSQLGHATYCGATANYTAGTRFASLVLSGSAWIDDEGLAIVNQSSPSSGATFTAAAALITDLVFALPGSPSANQIGVELRYRYQDASNYWTAYIQRNAGNTAWDFKLDSVSAGTPTNRITVTGVGTPTRLRAKAFGNLHDCYTLAGSTWTKRGGQISNATHNTQTTISPVAGTGATLTTLLAYPRTSATYDDLDGV